MLSERGQRFAKISHAHGPKSFYDPVNNPKGPVDFSNAENVLLNDRLTDFFNANVRIHRRIIANTIKLLKAKFDSELCTYGEGFTGSLQMRKAMAMHLNEYFQPDTAFYAEEFTFIAGVTALNEAMSFVTCDHETPDRKDAILLGSSIYGSFVKDLTTRTGVHLKFAAFGDIDQFSPACVDSYRTAFDDAARSGVQVKALLICNPHNPLGQCYTAEALRAIASFCEEKDIHLISDEIYALTTYQRTDRESETFHSVYAAGIDPGFLSTHVHIMYGMAKDYGAPGLRVGCLISRNQAFTDAVRAAASRFAAPSHYAISLCATLLEDRPFVDKFIEDSRAVLLKSRVHAEGLLKEAKISYHDKGNLPVSQTNGDEWDAEGLLLEKFRENGVIIASGKSYNAETPGKFRLLHGFPDPYVAEGVARIQKTLLEMID